ncbi:hypothetical protein C2S51_002888, partial [Perilla frutescens var. frutescens]
DFECERRLLLFLKTKQYLWTLLLWRSWLLNLSPLHGSSTWGALWKSKMKVWHFYITF